VGAEPTCQGNLDERFRLHMSGPLHSSDLPHTRTRIFLPALILGPPVPGGLCPKAGRVRGFLKRAVGMTLVRWQSTVWFHLRWGGVEGR
jgi:hypothetical protein